ncbi:unnamed protein product, partial [Tuber aestivum]
KTERINTGHIPPQPPPAIGPSLPRSDPELDSIKTLKSSISPLLK